MSKRLTVDLFVEDRAHEEFLRAMCQRLAREEQTELTVRIRSARGGHPRALAELKFYQQSVQRGLAGLATPDLLVAGIDTNCESYSGAKQQVEEILDPVFRTRTVVACPDPHVERWYLADLDSFHRVVGSRPTMGKKKCKPDFYKQILSRAVTSAGHPPTLGGIEFARELVEAMDLYRAGKSERSLKDFVDSARHAFRQAGLSEGGS